MNVDGAVDATDAATIESFLTLYQSTEVAVTPDTCMSNRIFPDANGDWLVNEDDIDFVGGLYGNTEQAEFEEFGGEGGFSLLSGSGSGSSSGSGGGSSSGSGGGMPTGSGMWGIAEPGFFVSGNEPLSEHVDHEQFVDFWVQFSDHNAEGGTVHWATEEISMESDASNGPAEEGEDFEIASGTITIPAGVSTYSTLVRVKVKFDELDEPTEWFRVRLSNPSSGTRIIQSEESQIGKIADRDCGCNRQQGSPPVAFPTVPASTVSDDEYTFAPDENGTQQPVTPVSAVDFDYVFEPTREHMQPEGFQFAWKMKFDANAVGLIGHQVVKTKIVGYDKDGNVVHTIESYVVDGLELVSKPA